MRARVGANYQSFQVREARIRRARSTVASRLVRKAR